MTLVRVTAPLNRISARRTFVSHSFRSWTPRWSVAPLALCAALLLSSHAARADFAQQGNKLVGSGGGGDLGSSVALSADGNTALVGGPGDNNEIGAAWMFTRSGGVWTQQGNKLVGSGATATAQQGTSVALSADGNTALVGGVGDGAGVGATWVFTRSGGVWSQQGSKLVGTGGGFAEQGTAVALSADGNTAMVGGPGTGTNTGAVWVFTRSGGVWTQQGDKLVGSGASGPDPAQQGTSVALSADGNTALVGGIFDRANLGSAWVFTRSGGVWTQQGNKLVGTGGGGFLGTSVALSADGNTAVIGGPGDDSYTGAAWVFTRNGGVWTQQGNKLVGTGAVKTGGFVEQGWSVALSADGNKAIVGGLRDNSAAGAAWVFTRSGGMWSQQGNKLVGTGATDPAAQGTSVALSADGHTAMVGGYLDNNGVGAAWVYVTAVAHDFNNDGKSDIAWRQNNSNVAIWLMNDASVASSGSFGAVPSSWQIVGQRDFNGDGKHDLLWRETTSGAVAIWFLDGAAISSTAGFGNIATNWAVVGTGDANGDGKGDILWRATTGDVAIWLMNGATISSSGGFGNVPTDWQVASFADFNGDGKADILWRNTVTGDTAVWFLDGTAVSSTASIGNVPTTWSIVATGDFNGDGKADIVWRDATGNSAIWLMNGATVLSAGLLGNVPIAWIVAETGDFNGDGRSDILWRNTATGDVAMWFMDGVALSSSASLGVIGTDWVIQG